MDIDLIKKTGEGQMSCLLSCCFTSGIIFSRTLNPEKPQNVEPQNTAQGDLALPGVKMNAGAVSCILHFPSAHFHQPAEMAHRDVAREVWGHLDGDRNQIQLHLQWEMVFWLLAILSSQQNNFHLGFHQRN